MDVRQWLHNNWYSLQMCIVNILSPELYILIVDFQHKFNDGHVSFSSLSVTQKRTVVLDGFIFPHTIVAKGDLECPVEINLMQMNSYYLTSLSFIFLKIIL